MAGSGVVVETTFDADGFKSIEAGYTCDLTVTKGDEFSVIVTSDDNLLDYLIVTISDEVLKIDLQPYTTYNNVIFKAAVVMPELESLTVSGASTANMTGFNSAGNFIVNITGASHGELSFLTVDNINATITGASQLTVNADSADGDLDINCSGASKADFRNFSADNVHTSVSGASSTWVNLSGSLSGSVTGASNLYYGGTPDISVSVDIASDLARY